jgi:hypothetical protein
VKKRLLTSVSCHRSWLGIPFFATGCRTQSYLRNAFAASRTRAFSRSHHPSVLRNASISKSSIVLSRKQDRTPIEFGLKMQLSEQRSEAVGRVRWGIATTNPRPLHRCFLTVTIPCNNVDNCSNVYISECAVPLTASKPPNGNPSILARFAASRERCGKRFGSRHCAMSMPANQEKQIMAELTHEQLWHVYQWKPSDYEPYG